MEMEVAWELGNNVPTSKRLFKKIGKKPLYNESWDDTLPEMNTGNILHSNIHERVIK